MLRRSTVLLLCLAAFAGACGTGPPDHVRIGVVAPLSGPRAFIGTELVNGAELAVASLNRNGGLLGRDVELVVIDDADLVDVPGSLAELAELQRVTAVLGPEVPATLLGPRSPLTRRGVPALLPTAFSGDLDQASSFVGRTIPGAEVQAEVLGRWLRTNRAGERVAILLADVVEGSVVLDDLRVGLESGGAAVAAVVEADGEATNLLPAVRRLRDEAPDADLVLLWGLPSANARATAAVRELGWDVQVAVSASSFAAEYRTLVRQDSEGVVLAFAYRDEWFDGSPLDQLMLDYYATYGLSVLPQLDTLVLDVPVVAIAAHDAIGLVAAAVEEAGTREPGPVAEALRTLHWDGILREYDFDDDGETWDADEVFVGRFHRLAVVFDVDPRLDAEGQRTFFTRQVTADYVPESLLTGPAGSFLARLLERGRQDLPTYAPPLPGPGPVARPGSPPAVEPDASDPDRG